MKLDRTSFLRTINLFPKLSRQKQSYLLSLSAVKEKLEW